MKMTDNHKQIIVYEAIDDHATIHRAGEQSERVEMADRPPIVGDVVGMGSNRQWQVLTIEIYVNTPHTVILALVHPIGVTIPLRTEWNQTTWKAGYPAISTNLLMRNGALEYYGKSMEGDAPTGRLYGGEATEHPTLLKPVPLPWAIDTVDCYKPVGNSSYSSIHICHCVPVSLPEMAVA